MIYTYVNNLNGKWVNGKWIAPIVLIVGNPKEGIKSADEAFKSYFGKSPAQINGIALKIEKIPQISIKYDLPSR